MAAETGQQDDRNPATPNSPYATVNMTWAGNNPVNPLGNPGAADSESAGNAHFSDYISLSEGTDSNLAGSIVPVRPPA